MMNTANPLNSATPLSTSLPTPSQSTANSLSTDLIAGALNRSSSAPINGLKGEYFQGKNFDQLKLTRVDQAVNFRWGTGAPAPNLGKDFFSVRWTGFVVPKYSETYTFYTNSDDGVRLWVNGQKLVDQWNLQAETEKGGSIRLEAGKTYAIKMEYFEDTGKATSQLLWSSPSQSKEIVPQSQLFSSTTPTPTLPPPPPAPAPAPVSPAPVISNGNGLKAEYFGDKELKNLKLTRTDATINFNWQNGAPAPTVGSDYFSVRWSGQIVPKYSETYTFYTNSDDGVRLWVNGQKLVDQWNLQAAKEHRGTITLEAGKKYDIRLEYFENTGKASAQLSWSSPSQSKEIVPQSQLFSGTTPTPTPPPPPPAPAPAPDSSPGTGGNNGSGGIIAPPEPIRYNEKPSVSVPNSKTTTTNTQLPLVGIQVSDPDAGNSNVTVTLQAANGRLDLAGTINGGVPLTGIFNNGTGTVVLIGTLLQINTTLASAAGLVYQPNQGFTGRDEVTVSVNDNGNSGVGGALTDTQTFSVMVGAAGTSYPNVNSPLGTNLSGIVYYSRELPFVDVFKMSDGFKAVNSNGSNWNGSNLRLRADGYPAALEAGQVAQTIVVSNGGKVPTGKYTVFYEGEGEIRLTGGYGATFSRNFPPGRMEFENTGHGMILQITSTNPNNPIRNIRVIMPGFENTYQQEPFNPTFLERLEKFKVLRFMDWQQTNHSNVKEWSDRTTLNSLTQASKQGVALEYMIDLANKLHTDAWFTIPHQASDNYIRQYATLIRDRLDPNLKVYVEYSNEVWNAAFQQYHYAKQKGLELGLSTNEFQAAMRYYSQRSVQVFKIFEEVFGGTARLERVLASQAANTWPQEQVLSWQDAYKSADKLAIAPYFEGDLNDRNKIDRTLSLTVDQALDILRESIRTKQSKWIADSSALSKQYGLDLIAYEGGQHLVSYQFDAAKQDAATDFFTRVNRSPGMKDVYTEYLNTWKDNGGGLFVNFSSVGSPSKWGWWGALEYQDQPISEAPKYQALMEFIDNNPVP